MLFPRLLVIALLTSLVAQAAETRSKPTRPSSAPAAASSAYKGAIVVDALTGNVLFEDRADTISPPASMTKLMTFAVVHEALANGTLRMDTPVKITVEDMKKGGTQVYLDPRETFPVEELIHAMMVQSANDAANALARATAGSASAFVELMNAKARELGMTNTTFRTPHGLPPATRKVAEGDLTTPRDFSLLSRYLVSKTDALRFTSVQARDFGAGKRKEPMKMRNHNNLLGKVDGVDGLKTGFTNGAGFCLAATAQRKGRRVVVVTMGSVQATTRDLAVSELIERGFASLPPAPVPPAIVPATAPAPVSSRAGAAPAAAPRDDSIIRPAPSAAKPPQAAAPAPEPTIKFSIPKK